MSFVQKLQDKLDLMCSLRDKRRNEKKSNKNIRKGIYRIYERFSNMIKDMHYKIIHHMTHSVHLSLSNDLLTIIPNANAFMRCIASAKRTDSQDMMKKFKNPFRKVRSSTRRKLNTLQHYQFKQRLIDKCSSLLNTKVVIVTEEYTTKTCTHCGHINSQVESDKIINCTECNVIVDRDVNGARNIYLKSITSGC